MAAHSPELRLLHRRVAAAFPDLGPRFKPTFCWPGDETCRHHRETTTPDLHTTPTDDLPSTLSPTDGTTTTSTTISVRATTTSIPSTSSTPTLRSAPATSTHRKSTTTVVKIATAPAAIHSASATSLPQSGSGSTSAIVGGIAGGVIGFALLLSFIAFIVRRARGKRDKGNLESFNSADFRRSAVLLNDPPTHQDTVIAGYNPMPQSTMAEHQPLTFGTLYGATAPNYGQLVVSPITDRYGPDSPMSPNTPSINSANPFIASAPYTPNPFSPISPPVTESPISTPIVTRSSSAALSRQNSLKTVTEGEPQYAAYPSMVSSSAPMPSGDYVDLSRSSVSPFQAAQYLEISKQIGSDVPNGLSTPAAEAQMPNLRAVDEDDAPPPPKKDRLSTASAREEVSTTRFSAASIQSDDVDTVDTRTMDFPVPPSPTVTSVSRYANRVDSTPPLLPEIRVESRASFATSTISQLSPFGTYDFPSSAVSSVFSSGISASAQIISIPPKSHHTFQGSFPATPSPLSSSFAPSLTADGSFDSAPITPKETKPRPDTVYDPDDAYGGI